MTALCLAVFWCAGALILYTYAGYPLLIGLLARLWPRPWIRAEVGADAPPVDVVVAAYDEAACIAAKIENTRALDYPPGRLALWVVADGSTDDTAAIVAAAAKASPDLPVHLLYEPERRGKAAALARVLPCLQGEFILFTDADSRLPADAVRRLARHLADPQVAAASGSKAIESDGGGSEGLYWRYESYLKACDSAVGSVMGVPGEIWLVRRVCCVAPEPDVLLEDFVASMRLVAAGRRVVYDPALRAIERAAPGPAAEFERRARNAAGGWQACCAKLGAVWRCGDPLVLWQFVSHRVLRWLVTPALFPLLLLANLGLLAVPFYRATLALQAVAYLAAAAGWVLAAARRRTGPLAVPLAVVLLNAAALAGAWRYLRGTQSVAWKKVR